MRTMSEKNEEIYDEIVPAANVNINLSTESAATTGTLSARREFAAAAIGAGILVLGILIGAFASQDDEDDDRRQPPPKTDTAAVVNAINKTVRQTLQTARELSEAKANRAHEGLNATLWVQTSAEYAALCRQAYANARHGLDRALKAKWAALPEQGALAALPRKLAIIMDLDETVLDNSPYQGQLVRDNESYTESSWKRWAELGAAKAIPGAVEFIDYATGKGVAVFFVTNRNHDVETATRKNLTDLGIAVSRYPDNVLTRKEKPDWGSDKSSRRSHVAHDHHVLLLVGDAANDFLQLGRLDPAARRAAFAKHRDYFGERWILLPNPNYGGWETALYGYDHALSDRKKIGLKTGQVRGFE